jgi:seryl-tRNA synthetase
MQDIRYIRDNSQKMKDAIKNKNIRLDLDELLAMDEERKKLQMEIDNLRARRNEISKFG